MDLFATQFSFSIQNQRNGKQTIVGQSISVIIIIISSLYLFYLMFNYFDGNHLPKITQVTEVNQSSNEIEYGNESPFSIRLFFQDQNIPENFELNKYIKVVVKYGQVWEGNTVDIELQKCIDLYPNQSNFYNELDLCLEENIFLKIQYNKQFDYYTDTAANVFIYQCEGVNCATQPEIENIINNYQMVGLFKIRLKEFDQKTKALQDVIIEKYITFDMDSFSVNRYILQKSTIDIDDGIFLSNQQQFTYINDYVQENLKVSTFTKDKYPQFINHKMLGFHSFLINMNTKLISVQYPKLTESLAQFVSVFNILSIIGFLAKFCSEVKLFEQIMENHVKFYYQKMVSLTPEKKIDKIFDYNIFQSFKNYLENSFYSKYHKNKNQLQYNSCSLNSEKKNFIYQNLFGIVEGQIDLDNIFKELFFLKTCVQTLMTKEQYAAVRYCGRNPPSVTQLQACTSKDQLNSLNHLEQLDLIDKNPFLCEQYLQEFQKLQENDNNSIYNNSKNQQLQQKVIGDEIDSQRLVLINSFEQKNVQQQQQSLQQQQEQLQEKQLQSQQQKLQLQQYNIQQQQHITNQIIQDSLLDHIQIELLQNKLYGKLKQKLLEDPCQINYKSQSKVNKINNIIGSKHDIQ